MNWMLPAIIALYTLGLLHSIIGFYQKRSIFLQLALGMVAAGFACHSILLIRIGLQRGHFPITNLPEALCFFAWCVSLAFIFANFRYRIHALGAFLLPLVSILMIISQLFGEENRSIPAGLQSGWVYFHGSVAFIAYAAFFLTFIAGVLYLVQEKELKEKNFHFFYFHLPSLQVCDELLRRSLFIGFASMSITIISGAFRAQQVWGRFWSWEPKQTAALITWIIYFILVNYRLSSKWQGKRAAYIGILGFVSTLCTFCINWGLHAYL
jgi:cytochrome c-type biogenesis protein CcsB